MRGAGQLGVGTEVEMVGDVANRMEKLEAAIGNKAGSGARAHSGMEWLIPYLGYSIDLLYI